MMDIPSFLIPYLESNALQRLKGIDMNCGVNHTAFPLFADIRPYSMKNVPRNPTDSSVGGIGTNG